MTKTSATYDHLAAQIAGELPAGPRLIVIGSAGFWHPESEPLCEQLGRHIACINDLVLITGGVGGVGTTIGKSFYRDRQQQGKSAVSVFHVLPEGARAPNYGRTFFAGQDMFERREVLGRLGSLYLAIEGGPGTAHEAQVAGTQRDQDEQGENGGF
jgi:predicted Rossmann-fold nucleotide-binding protein